MSTALLIMTDGRDECLGQAVASALETVGGQVGELWIHDDTGDEAHRRELSRRYPRFGMIWHGPGRAGFGGAIRSAWSALAEHSEADHVAHVEDDFVFRRPVDLAAMAEVLDAHPYLIQLALRRQPWNPTESAAGGIVEANPEAYTDCWDEAGREWLEHRLFFTTNPSLYRLTLCEEAWPSGARSEGHFTHQLLHRGVPGVPGDQIRFGFWGARDSGEWVEHIGLHRVGTGY